MVTVDEAFGIILSHLFPTRITEVDIANSAGRILAEEVVADRDFPPFNRVAMDGIAIAYRSWERGQRKFPIEGVQSAGSPPRNLTNSAHCLEVMTGAVLPDGSDTVIRYEDIQIDGRKATLKTEQVSAGQNVHHRGKDSHKGDILLAPPKKISPAEVAMFAATGKTHVRVFDFPRTAVVSSGDELVDVDQIPEPHQIRRSNLYALQAAMKEIGWNSERFHFRDDRTELFEGLKNVLANSEVVILSGGVSKGKFDFIPEVLEANGIRKKFHQVSQRPGKPFWFGVSDEGKVVFALPGNPVSTYMCYYRFVRPWIERSFGLDATFPLAVLGEDLNINLPLTYFLQVETIPERGMFVAYPRTGGGSGDFGNLKEVTGFLELPPSAGFKRGDLFPYIAFR